MSGYSPAIPRRDSCWPPSATSRAVTPKSLPSNRIRAPTSFARSRRISATSRSWMEETVIAPGLMMPDFSVAISSTVEPEQLRVVDRHRRHDRDLAVGDVGRVPRATEADLHDGDVHGGVGERRVGEDHRHHEEVQRLAAGRHGAVVDELHHRLHLVVDLDQPLGVDRLAADGDPLAERVQVRRREPSRGQAQSGQQGVDHPGRRRLAVGPGQVDDGVGALGVAEEVHHLAHGVERGVDVGLGRAREDRLLDVEQPPQRVRVRGGETAGALRARAVAHPAATGRDIQMVSGSPPDPGSRSTSTNPLRA